MDVAGICMECTKFVKECQCDNGKAWREEQQCQNCCKEVTHKVNDLRMCCECADVEMEDLQRNIADFWEMNAIPCAACQEPVIGKTALSPSEGEDGNVCAHCLEAHRSAADIFGYGGNTTP